MGNKKAGKESLADTALGLLAEVAEICDANGIEYYLAPKMVLRSLKKVDYDTYFTMPEVFMTLDNALSFVSVIEQTKPAGRSLDYLITNESYASFNFSYVNTNTTYIDDARGDDFSQFGIKVTISLIRNDIKNRIPAFVETGRERNAFKAIKKGNWKQKTVESIVARSMALGGGEYNKRLFDYYVRNYSKHQDSPKVFIRRFRQKRVYYDRSLFRKTTVVELGSYSFVAPADTETYLNTYYMRTADLVSMYPYNKQSTIISNEVPFQEYIERLKQMNISVRELFELNNEIRSEKLKDENNVKAVKDVYRIAKMSSDRARLYKELYPQIDTIRAYYQQEDFDKIREIFSEYDYLAKYYLRRQLALCPEEELFEIECALMVHDNHPELAEKMRTCLYEPHKKPLTGNDAVLD